VIFFAQDEQMTPVENDGSRGLLCTSAKMPGKGREEPRPAKQLAITYHLNRCGPLSFRACFQGHRAGFDEEELIRGFAFPKYYVIGFVIGLIGSFDNKIDMLRQHSRKKRMIFNQIHGGRGYSEIQNTRATNHGNEQRPHRLHMDKPGVA
jgi:hypothetical protein